MIEPGGVVTLLDRVEAYLVRYELSPSRFGVFAVSSPSLVSRMREGKNLRAVTVNRIEAVLNNPWRYSNGAFHRLSRGQFIRRTILSRRYTQAIKDNQRAEAEERSRRLNEPAEQAATFLRRQGWVVHLASVLDETPSAKWALGRLRLDDDALLQRARDKGWRG